MGKVTSGATGDQLTIDITSKAARMTPYDSIGINRGVKPTYRAATTANVVAAAGAAMFFVITGSTTRTLFIQRIRITGPTLTAVAYNSLVVEKWSTAPTGGTAAALTQVPLDANSSAGTANLCQVYTAAPTEGTLIGTVACRRLLLEATTAVAAAQPPDVEFDFRPNGEAGSIVLRGTAQALSVAFGAAPASAVTLGVEVEWSEE